MDSSTIITFVVIALIAWFVYLNFKPTKGLSNLNTDAFRAAMTKPDRPIVIDVREPGEYKGGHIPGATNIPLSQFTRRLSEIPKDRPVLLYCRSGMRSKSAAKLLLRSGYPELAHLQGGIGAWDGELKR